MRSTSRLLLSALAATALFAALASSASAREFEFSNQSIRTVFRPLTIQGGGSTVRCTLTLEGTFHSRIIRKVAASLLGYITRARFDERNCTSSGLSTGIRSRVLEETLPWHMRYVSFIGTLPAVRIRYRVGNVTFDLVNIPLIATCRYRVDADFIFGGPAGGNINEGAGTTIRAEEGTEIAGTPAGCPRTRLSDAAEPVTLLATGNAIIIRLI